MLCLGLFCLGVIIDVSVRAPDSPTPPSPPPANAEVSGSMCLVGIGILVVMLVSALVLGRVLVMGLQVKAHTPYRLVPMHLDPEVRRFRRTFALMIGSLMIVLAIIAGIQLREGTLESTGWGLLPSLSMIILALLTSVASAVLGVQRLYTWDVRWFDQPLVDAGDGESQAGDLLKPIITSLAELGFTLIGRVATPPSSQGRETRWIYTMDNGAIMAVASGADWALASFLTFTSEFDNGTLLETRYPVLLRLKGAKYIARAARSVDEAYRLHTQDAGKLTSKLGEPTRIATLQDYLSLAERSRNKTLPIFKRVLLMYHLAFPMLTTIGALGLLIMALVIPRQPESIACLTSSCMTLGAVVLVPAGLHLFNVVRATRKIT